MNENERKKIDSEIYEIFDIIGENFSNEYFIGIV